MQKGPSQVSSGNIAPTVVGPQRDSKDVMILAGLVLFLGGLLAAAWYYGQVGDQVKATPAIGNVDHANVSEILKKAGALNQAEASTSNSTPVTAPAASMPEIIHSDVYFEVGRKGLTDEGKALLAAHAGMLTQHEEYGVLIQGYTDQQGSAGYNKQLGLKRAETVKAALLNAGIGEHRIKVVSLGEEGVLCVDTSDFCRHMNRRTHLEIRKIGREHMVVPAAAVTTATEPAEPSPNALRLSTGLESDGQPAPSPAPETLSPDPPSGS